MNRKIKFRVWDEEKKKYCTEYNAMTLKHDGEFCIERGWCTISGGFEVEQSTLLKDKNGKDIYEGDIIREKWYDNDVNRGRDRIGKIEYFCDRASYERQRLGTIGKRMERK